MLKLHKISLSALALIMPLSAFAVGSATPPAATTPTRGQAGQAQAYRQQQMQQYYMVQTPDVDTACRQKIFQCLSDYCGDITGIPGVYQGRCQYATEGELYNWALLCIQKDYEDLMPQYNLYNKAQNKPVNTAARLCPTYIQQEVMSFLSMSLMAGKLAQQRSTECTDARAELAAALSCHETTMIYALESSSMLDSMLTDSCGSGVVGGSRAMVQKFMSAGNVGGSVWGWVEKIITMDAVFGSEKARGWESAVDAIAAGYVNRMNAACGESMQFQAIQRYADNSPGVTQQALTLLVSSQTGNATTDPKKLGGGSAFPAAGGAAFGGNKKELVATIQSNYAIYDYATAAQVVQAGLTNPITTQNPFLTSAQMNTMQQAKKNGTKVFMIKDSSRCFIVAVEPLSESESNLLAPQLASCAYN
ncbi:MAG: hypothetical protein LBG89_03215 [Rickettsiales bacterium]|jgi:hypothetical protein|nr:hypothetical protein [Rickettsiales bacterium]